MTAGETMNNRNAGAIGFTLIALAVLLMVSPLCWSEGISEPTDVDGDGRLTLQDIERVLIVIREGRGPAEADVNKDGKVDLEDLDLVTEAYLKSEAPESSTK